MIINRHNYEEFFLLYVDNELSAPERRVVEAFVKENADLEEELITLRQSVFRPDKKMVFRNQGQLMKKSSGMVPINELNYSEYFVLYGDNELSMEENDMVEQFVYRHPQYQVEFELIQQARFSPDTSIAFPDKSSLYRSEKDEKVVPFGWWKIAVAAVVLLFVGALGWNYFFTDSKNGTIETPPIAGKNNVTEQKGDESKGITPDSNVTAPYVAKEKIESQKENTVTNRKSQKTIEAIQPKDQPLIASTETDEKIKSAKSNIPIVESVTLTGTGNPGLEKIAGASITDVKIIDVAVDPEAKIEKMNANDPQASYAVNNSNELEVLNTSFSKKNPSRGFFRKVSRVIGKVTNIGLKDKENDNSKGLRIANFEIALK